jgi:serine/threonine protein phosphatase PrpC
VNFAHSRRESIIETKEPYPYSEHNRKRSTESQTMTTKTLTNLLIAALLAASAAAYADETPIQMAMEDGKAVAQFKVGDSRCVLVDDQIRCTPVGK